MNLKEKIEAVVEASGLWSGGRRQSHSFLLSPEVYKVSAGELKQLEILGKYLQEVLQGFSQIMAKAFEKRLEGEEKQARWYLRITAHFSLGKVADLVVTARPDRRVHGAKDSLQFGSIIE